MKKTKKKPPVAMIVLESVAGAIGILGLVCMVLLLRLPVTVFSIMHYGWIIGIGIASPLYGKSWSKIN